MFYEKIRNRLVILLVIATSVPVFSVALLSYYSSNAAVEKQFLNSNFKLIEVANQNLDAFLVEKKELTLSLFKDPEFVKNLGKEESSAGLSQNTNSKYVENQLLNMISKRKGIENIILYSVPEDKLYYISVKKMNFYYIQTPDFGKEEWYTDAVKNKKVLRIQGPHSFQFNIRQKGDTQNPSALIDNPVKNVITMSFALSSVPSNEFLGVISYNFSLGGVQNSIEKSLVYKAEKAFIINTSGTILYSKEDKDLFQPIEETIFSGINFKQQQGSFKSKVSGKDSLVIYNHSVNSDWLIVKIIPLEALNRETYKTGKINILIGILFVMFGIIISFLISYSISEPIVRLANYMKQIKRNSPPVSDQYKRADEIGTLYNSFDEMIQRINFLINEEYKARLREKTAQIKALQSQINPHFLYNTLQSISSLAIANNVPEINYAIKSLGAMLRYAIKSSEDVVTLREEIEHVENYFIIQKLRYQERIQYTFDIPEELYPTPIPKLTLQPIVENAVIHGLESKIDVGRINIKGWADSGKVFLEIKDNGIGIQSEKLKELNMLIRDDSQIFKNTKGLGLYNVNARIIYTLGNDCGIEISSVYGEGTRIIITLKEIGGDLYD